MSVLRPVVGCMLIQFVQMFQPISCFTVSWTCRMHKCRCCLLEVATWFASGRSGVVVVLQLIISMYIASVLFWNMLSAVEEYPQVALQKRQTTAASVYRKI